MHEVADSVTLRARSCFCRLFVSFRDALRVKASRSRDSLSSLFIDIHPTLFTTSLQSIFHSSYSPIRQSPINSSPSPYSITMRFPFLSQSDVPPIFRPRSALKNRHIVFPSRRKISSYCSLSFSYSYSRNPGTFHTIRRLATTTEGRDCA